MELEKTYTLYLFLILLSICISFLIVYINSYYRSTYYKEKKVPLTNLIYDAGALGEYKVYKSLVKYEKRGAKFLFNCYLPKENDETSEIDVIMIYKSGIYVFESKNYGGWIFGSEDDNMWTQTLPSGRKAQKERFYNPIMQNRTHIKWLKNQVGNNVPIHNIVVFSQRCELKKINIHSLDVAVIRQYALPVTVHRLDVECPEALSAEEMNALYNKIYPSTQVSNSVKQAHIKKVQEKMAGPSPVVQRAGDDGNELSLKESAPETNEFYRACPRCGNKLVLRTAKRGEMAGNQFYGCSSYPKCKYIENLKI